LPSFGERLKLEREKRKITLEQISVSTKIGTRMLQALEEDKFNQLPGGIFNKGFVRAYSRCVGLDEDQTVAEYLEASGDVPPVPTEPGSREDKPAKMKKSSVAKPAPFPCRQLLGLNRRSSPRRRSHISFWSVAGGIIETVSRSSSRPPWSRRRGDYQVQRPANRMAPPRRPEVPRGPSLPKYLRTSRLLLPPHHRASLRSSSKPAKIPGSRSPPTADLSPPNSCSPAASAPREAGRKLSSRQET
jgi:transcriptional regulator with XRE-family HTH domain